MTKKLIDDIPKPELRAQPINATHRQEFVVEFTGIIFKPKIVAAVPPDMGDWMSDLEKQKAMLAAAFPVLQKPEIGVVYGTRRGLCDLLEFQHQKYRAVQQALDGWHMSDRIFGFEVRGDNIEGKVRAFAHMLSEAVNKKLPNVQASKDYHQKLELEYHKCRNGEDNPDTYMYVPNGIRGISDLLSESKKQAADGTITRTPVIKSQYVPVIPKKVQATILAWDKKNRAELGVQKLHDQIRLMYTFSQELYEGIKCVRTTKQFQERYPGMFDEFCSITGLGQCDGKDLMCATDMATVTSILSEYKKPK